MQAPRCCLRGRRPGHPLPGPGDPDRLLDGQGEPAVRRRDPGTVHRYVGHGVEVHRILGQGPFVVELGQQEEVVEVQKAQTESEFA